MGLIGIVILCFVAAWIINPIRTRYYYERTLIFFGFCPRCKEFSMQKIKDYRVCTICRKR